LFQIQEGHTRETETGGGRVKVDDDGSEVDDDGLQVKDGGDILEVDGNMLQAHGWRVTCLRSKAACRVGDEVAAHFEAGVEAAAYSEARDEAVACSKAEIEDDKRWWRGNV
jgi:hypothetical protein